MDYVFILRQFWKKNTDYRSYLYFSYLLHIKYADIPRPELHSFLGELKKYTTIQNGFPHIANDLVVAGIVEDKSRYLLHPDAIVGLDKIFRETFGTSDYKLLRFNGIELYDSNSPEDGFTKWSLRATNDFANIFCDVPINVKPEARPNLYVISTVETANDEPFICWGFYNISRMDDYKDCFELIQVHGNKRDERLNNLIREIDGYSVSGARGIAIIGAITYGTETAEYIVNNGLHSIGPINYEALIHYFDCHLPNDDGSDEVKGNIIIVRREQYKALLEALSFIPAGVILSDDVISYIDNKLSSVYNMYNINGNLC
jgi:hypothetical protein